MAKKASPRRNATKAKTNAEPTEKKAETSKKRFNSPVDEGDRARFLHHLPKVKAAREAVKTATAKLRNLYKEAKADNFTKADFDYAFDIETPEKETGTKATIARRLLIAKFMGSDLGAQLDLFAEPDRTPAVDRAFEEGRTASMQGQPAQPGYDPSTPQYASYLDGFHSHQKILLEKGIKPLKADPPKRRGAKAAEDDFAAEQAENAEALAALGYTEESPL